MKRRGRAYPALFLAAACALLLLRPPSSGGQAPDQEGSVLGQAASAAAARPALPACASAGGYSAGPPLPRTAIIYLVHSRRLGQLKESLASLFRYFNDVYRYPILLFHEEELDPAAALAALGLSPDKQCLLRFEKVVPLFPPGFDPQKALAEGVVFSERFPGYQHMCAWWFEHMFTHPAVTSLDYYMRLDTDSVLEGPVRYDLFRFFAGKGFQYGYRYQMVDPPNWTVGLWGLVARYLEERRLPRPPGLAFPPPEKANTTGAPLYYNNFEVMHVPAMTQRRGVRDFIQAVSSSDGIYTHRWGDAPLRYFWAQIFLDVGREVHHFCDIPYRHKENPCRPTCSQPGLDTEVFAGPVCQNDKGQELV